MLNSVLLAFFWYRKRREDFVRKFTMTLAAVALVLGAMASEASAQQQLRGAACFRALNNASSIVKRASCDGGTGYCGCGPGWVSACAPRCCRCVPCY
jgi:hypothetical protein